MTPPPGLSRRVLVALVGALALAACSSPTGSTAATVGDATITNARVAADADLYAFLSGLSGAPCATPVEGESDEAACARLALSNDIREELVKAYAVEHDLTVQQSAIDEAIAQLEGSVGGADALDTQLADAGVTREQLLALAGRLLLFNEVQTDLVEDRLDDAAVQEAYQEQLPAFTTVEVAHILVDDEADARRIADEVTPETFAEVAERESTDPGSAANGGNLGSYSQADFESQFVPEFVAGALALDAGEISPPVRTDFGWHVIYMIGRDVAPLEDVRDQLVAQMPQTAEIFDTWFHEEADATAIDVNPRFGRLDLETLEVVPVRSTAEEPTRDTAPASTGP